MENNLKLMQMNFSKEHINLDKCPMCKSNNLEKWGETIYDFNTVKCVDCNLIFVQNPWNEETLSKYYSIYYSNVHQKNDDLNEKREEMYKIELNFLRNFKKSGRVLDIGCSGGQFLKHFKKVGFECEGVEFGVEAAKMASDFFKIHVGNFPDLEFNDKYDVIIFRGCIEHVSDPLKYLEKAKDILNEDGVIFFTATPNRDSFTCDLFKEKWNMHYPFEHLYHFSPVDLINFYKAKGLKSFSEKNIYLNSPYINIKNDLSLVLKKLNGEDVICPPFFDNMLTLVLLF